MGLLLDSQRSPSEMAKGTPLLAHRAPLLGQLSHMGFVPTGAGKGDRTNPASPRGAAEGGGPYPQAHREEALEGARPSRVLLAPSRIPLTRPPRSHHRRTEMTTLENRAEMIK